MNRFKFIFLLFLLVILIILSLMIGSRTISFNVLFDYLIKVDKSDIDHILIETSRIPRTIISILVGASLSVSGVLIQALSRNPMASPSILGINASAMFFIVVLSSFFKFSSMEYYLWSSFIGAAFGGVLVWFVATLGTKQLNVLRVLLVGSAISALFYSFTQAFLIINKEGLEDILFWLAGSVSTKELDVIFPLLPYFIFSLVLSFLLAPHIDILAIGDDTAKALGQNINTIHILMAVSIIFLAGGSVSIAGAIGFIGLLVPHITKKIFPPTNRWIIPASALIGANLLLLADIISRFIMSPSEIPIGVMTAFIGAPFFIYLILKGKKYE